MSSNLSLFSNNPLDKAFRDLKKDLINEDGPRISTMRNYRFAILQYDPSEEFKLRQQVQSLSSELVANGWVVVSISLQQLLLDRIRNHEDDWARRVIDTERGMFNVGPERGLNYLRTKIAPLVEGPEGIAADCSRIIAEHIKKHPESEDRTLALIGRVGALYPFFRSSALLKHIDGKTNNVPVVLLYPGERRGPTGLSFMGMLDSDNDYRPRIYP